MLGQDRHDICLKKINKATNTLLFLNNSHLPFPKKKVKLIHKRVWGHTSAWILRTVSQNGALQAINLFMVLNTSQKSATGAGWLAGQRRCDRGFSWTLSVLMSEFMTLG